jgi:DNA-binding CsgD family transcriptional regulator
MGGHATWPRRDDPTEPSSVALRRLMDLQRDSMVEAVSRLSDDVTQLVGLLMEERGARDAGRALPDVIPLRGESFAAAVRDARAGAVRELLEVRPLADHGADGPAGVATHRVIYASGSATVEESSTGCGLTRDHALYRRECRPLLIVDGTVAVMAVDGGTLNGITIDDGPVVALLRAYFDVLWSQSVRCGRADAPSPVAVRVLTLLSRGYRDDVAARALGLSVRTVRRHVAEVARRLNVTTRFAIGFHAYLKGWIR